MRGKNLRNVLALLVLAFSWLFAAQAATAAPVVPVNTNTNAACTHGFPIQYLQDVTLPSDPTNFAKVPAGTHTVKTWLVVNCLSKAMTNVKIERSYAISGGAAWKAVNPQRVFPIPDLLPGKPTEVSVPLVVPEKGKYEHIYAIGDGKGTLYEDFLTTEIEAQ